MIRCPKCNALIDEDEQKCPECGKTIYQTRYREGCLIPLILEFFSIFIPFFGIFLFMFIRNKKPKTAKILLLTSIVSTIIMVLTALFIVIVGIEIFIEIFS